MSHLQEDLSVVVCQVFLEQPVKSISTTVCLTLVLMEGVALILSMTSHVTVQLVSWIKTVQQSMTHALVILVSMEADVLLLPGPLTSDAPVDLDLLVSFTFLSFFSFADRFLSKETGSLTMNRLRMSCMIQVISSFDDLIMS